MSHYVVFDLETVPDLGVARRLLGLDATVADEAVRTAIAERYVRPGQEPADVFLKTPFHRIVCLGALYAERLANGPFVVRSIGARHVGERTEAQLLGGFVTNLPRDEQGRGPVLASFNGNGFDLPVLRYRAMALGVPAPALLGRNGRDYWYRFGWDHLDLCDLLSNFGASAKPSLNEMAALLGIPAKLEGMEGSQVEAFAEAGRLDEIASYCLGDVITTFRVLLRFALARGELDPESLAESERTLDLAIESRARQQPALAAMRTPA